jgi:HEAT repeat protein
MVAAVELAEHEKAAAAATAALIEALRDPNPRFRSEVAEALSRAGKPAVPALCDALTDPDPRVRAGAARALGNLPTPKFARDRSAEERDSLRARLKKLLKDPDAEVRASASETLRDLGVSEDNQERRGKQGG